MFHYAVQPIKITPNKTKNAHCPIWTEGVKKYAVPPLVCCNSHDLQPHVVLSHDQRNIGRTRLTLLKIPFKQLL